MIEKIIKEKKQLISIVAVILVVIAIIAIIFYKGYSNARARYEEEILSLKTQVDELSNPVAVYDEVIKEDDKELDIAVINAMIEDIGELATVEYMYTNCEKYTESKKVKLLTTKTLIAKWDGVIKAGIDVADIETEVDHDEKVVNITIPHARILSHEIDNDSYEVLDEKDGLFNKISAEDTNSVGAMSKEKMEERAIDKGVLEKAEENAKVIVKNLVKTEADAFEYKVDVNVK